MAPSPTSLRFRLRSSAESAYEMRNRAHHLEPRTAREHCKHGFPVVLHRDGCVRGRASRRLAQGRACPGAGDLSLGYLHSLSADSSTVCGFFGRRSVNGDDDLLAEPLSAGRQRNPDRYRALGEIIEDLETMLSSGSWNSSWKYDVRNLWLVIGKCEGYGGLEAGEGHRRSTCRQ